MEAFLGSIRSSILIEYLTENTSQSLNTRTFCLPFTLYSLASEIPETSTWKLSNLFMKSYLQQTPGLLGALKNSLLAPRKSTGILNVTKLLEIARRSFSGFQVNTTSV